MPMESGGRWIQLTGRCPSKRGYPRLSLKQQNTLRPLIRIKHLCPFFLYNDRFFCDQQSHRGGWAGLERLSQVIIFAVRSRFPPAPVLEGTRLQDGHTGGFILLEYPNIEPQRLLALAELQRASGSETSMIVDQQFFFEVVTRHDITSGLNGSEAYAAKTRRLL
jgi:hypothetical protein